MRDFDRAVAFYDRAVAPLGIKRLMTLRPGDDPADNSVDKRKLVDEFYRAALAAGGKDNGAPGPRPHYHQHYYGAFVFDLDGHNIEAVCHKP